MQLVSHSHSTSAAPLAARKERSDIGHNESQPVQDCPGDADALQPCPALVHSTPGTGEVHHQERHRGCDDGGYRGNEKNLAVHILHDLIGLCPYIHSCISSVRSGKYGQCGCEECHGTQECAIDGMGYGQFSVPGYFLFLCLCVLLLSLFLQLLILLHVFGFQNRNGCLRYGVQPALSFPAASVLGTDFSIFILTYGDLRGKSKTVPISCQFYANSILSIFHIPFLVPSIAQLNRYLLHLMNFAEYFQN